MKQKKSLPILLLILAAVAVAYFTGQGNLPSSIAPSSAPETAATAPLIILPSEAPVRQAAAPTPAARGIDENGAYTKAEDVALYIFTYERLPGNFITKAQARELGWPGGDLRPYAPNKAIGGDRFGNYEGLLPEKKGRVYYECDIETLNKSSRGAKRLVYSNDGLVFYTTDHYESFTQIFLEDLHAQP